MVSIIFLLVAGLSCWISVCTARESKITFDVEPPFNATQITRCDTRCSGCGRNYHSIHHLCWLDQDSLFLLTNYEHRWVEFLLTHVDLQQAKCEKVYKQPTNSPSTRNPNYCYKGKAYVAFDSHWGDEKILTYDQKGDFIGSWQPVGKYEGNVWHVAVNGDFLVLSVQNFSAWPRHWFHVYSNDNRRNLLYRFENVDEKIYHDSVYLSNSSYLWTAGENSDKITVYNFYNGFTRVIPGVTSGCITGSGKFVFVADRNENNIRVYEESGLFMHVIEIGDSVSRIGYFDVYPSTGNPDRLAVWDEGSRQGRYYYIFNLH